MEIQSLSNKLSRICRICLRDCMTETSRSIFGELKDSEILGKDVFFVFDILREVTTVAVSKDDGYPTLICFSCMDSVNEAYKLKYECQLVQVLLKKCLKHKSIVCKPSRPIYIQDYKEVKNLPESNNLEICNNKLEDGQNDCIFELKEDSVTPKMLNLAKINPSNLEEVLTSVGTNMQILFDSTKANVSEDVNQNDIDCKCAKCCRVFKSTYEFAIHTCNVTDRKLCPTCGKSISRSYFKSHLYMHTGRRDYICKICNKAYNAPLSLKFHMAKHTGDRPYLCSLCGKSFIQPTTLKYHMRFHNNERRYKCDVCPKTFIMQCHLAEHYRAHTGIKPYVCDTCGRQFSRKVELKLHMYVHLGRKPHTCKFCEKSFSRKTLLKWHEMMHRGERPHSCEVCGIGFLQKRPLVIHMKKCHCVDERV